MGLSEIELHILSPIRFVPFRQTIQLPTVGFGESLTND
jgi:hypothetical protein